MKNWLSRMDYKYGRKAPQRLMLLIAGAQMVVWLATWLLQVPLLAFLDLNRPALLHGQVWRLVSFLFVPVSLNPNPLFFALSVYMIYWIGSSLENAWGSFKFDVYLLLGMAGSWVACLLTGAASAMGIYYSMFFAFAYLYPEMQILLFFIIPVKVKWLGLFAGVMYVINILFSGSLMTSLALLVGVVNFLVFFGGDGWNSLRRELEQRRRRREWQNQWRNS